MMLLTLRQFLRSRALWVVAIVMALPLAPAIVTRVLSDEYASRQLRRLFGDISMQSMWLPTLLPLATLIVATAAFGDEIDDKTLHYLVLKPVSRFRIIVEKWIAASLVAYVVASIVLLITWGTFAWTRFDTMSDLIMPSLVAFAVGVLAYGSLFLMLSLVVKRALTLGVFYIFIWESLLARFLPGMRNVSISHYARSIFSNLAADDRLAYTDAVSNQDVWLMLAIVVIVSIILATWRLRSMAVD